MKDERPAVGDLCYVFRWPCCGKAVGVHGTVVIIESHQPHPGDRRCGHCHALNQPWMAPLFARLDNNGYYPLETLRKVPPAKELEGLKTQEPTREHQPANT